MRSLSRMKTCLYLRLFQGTYRLCFKNEQYFTSKIIYIGVLSIHSDLLAEANYNTAQEKKANDSAAVEEFSSAVKVNFIDVYLLSCQSIIGRVP
jgi:hypothetical protein